MSYSRVSSAAKPLALMLARGDYQENLIDGVESLSGSTLKGAAKQYAGRYKASAASLIERLRAAGLHAQEARGAHGKRILVICLPCEVETP